MPDQRRSAENGGVLALDTAGQELYLVLEDAHHVLLHVPLRRLEDVFSGLGQAAEEDESRGRREYHHVGHGLAQDLAGVVKDVLGQLVAVHGSVVHVLRGDGVDVEIAQQRGLGTDFQELAGGAGHTRGRAICLEATRAAAAAEASVVALHYHVAQLAGKAVVAVDHLTVDHDARPHAGTESDHDEILEASGTRRRSSRR